MWISRGFPQILDDQKCLRKTKMDFFLSVMTSLSQNKLKYVLESEILLKMLLIYKFVQFQIYQIFHGNLYFFIFLFFLTAEAEIELKNAHLIYR